MKMDSHSGFSRRFQVSRGTRNLTIQLKQKKAARWNWNDSRKWRCYLKLLFRLCDGDRTWRTRGSGRNSRISPSSYWKREARCLRRQYGTPHGCSWPSKPRSAANSSSDSSSFVCATNAVVSSTVSSVSIHQENDKCSHSGVGRRGALNKNHWSCSNLTSRDPETDAHNSQIDSILHCGIFFIKCPSLDWESL